MVQKKCKLKQIANFMQLRNMENYLHHEKSVKFITLMTHGSLLAIITVILIECRILIRTVLSFSFRRPITLKEFLDLTEIVFITDVNTRRSMAVMPSNVVSV